MIKTRIKTATGNKRCFHWLIAASFAVMLLTGLIIYTNEFSTLASGGITRSIHRIAAIVLIASPATYALINRKAARQ